ncbi:hypothetical protein Y1Q_0020258 [Alligator mississippiensis]|uniref:Uncharacterized protein n=1 Tax=Alligator mississippiensis TaxID=8496 RepID=A0A151PJF7_ALLMI|nr:hypothetical protein Y1Q_0020258 [Alligator mississippiensis]
MSSHTATQAQWILLRNSCNCCSDKEDGRTRRLIIIFQLLNLHLIPVSNPFLITSYLYSMVFLALVNRNGNMTSLKFSL